MDTKELEMLVGLIGSLGDSAQLVLLAYFAKGLLHTLIIMVPLAWIVWNLVKLVARAVTLRGELADIVGALDREHNRIKRQRLYEVVQENAEKIRRGFG